MRPRRREIERAQEAVRGPGASTPGRVAGNLVTNGTFDTDTGWSSVGSNGRTISGGTLNFDDTPQFFDVLLPIVVTGGASYRVTFTVTSFTAGEVRAGFTGGTESYGSGRTAVGTYQQTIVANAGNNMLSVMVIGGDGLGGNTLSVDDLSVFAV